MPTEFQYEGNTYQTVDICTMENPIAMYCVVLEQMSQGGGS